MARATTYVLALVHYIYIYTHMHTHIYIYIYTSISICTHTRIHTYKLCMLPLSRHIITGMLETSAF